MHARIAGLGQWLPETVRTNAAWPPNFAEIARTSERRELIDIENRPTCRADEITLQYMASEADDPFLGATLRRAADPTVTAPEAEAAAATAALAEAQLRPSDVDVIMSWALVPERISPPSAPKVAHLIGATRAYAVGIDAACASTVAQIEFAAALIESGRAKNVLLTQSHLLTRLFRLIHPASPTVGDAATAVVVSASGEPSILRTLAVSDGQFYDAITWCRGSTKDPPWWQAGSGYYMGSRDIAGAHELVRSTVRLASQTIAELAELNGMSVSDFDVLASVQPRRWIPAAIVEALGGRMLAPHTFDQLGHLGGCGVVTNLMAARSNGQLAPGSHAVLYAQGGGFTRAATLVRW
jgi:3-oxoacyl-[acyl-carrier-protein] synthase III